MEKTNRKKIELLAPAGSYEIFKVAIEAGADAVYLAGKMFGARAFAPNFTDEELVEAVKYAHLRDVKVYVTINTIIYEPEFDKLEKYINFLYNACVDAIIVQDLGVINLVRTKWPDFEIHASTQMNIFDKKGLDVLKDLGIKRVVLARETSLNKIKQITNCGIEIETFIHGALCFSASGNCLMSYSIGKRSGNRGECAQPCRKNYSLLENKKLLKTNEPLLSMKDLSTINDIQKLIDAGIDSLKIEGRMKSAEYVYTVVSAYRKAIDKTTRNLDLDIKKMKTIFNRSFTSGYILNVNNFDLVTNNYVNHQGIEVGKVIKVTPRAIEIKLSDNLAVQDSIRIDTKNSIGFTIQTMFLNNQKVKDATKNNIIKIPITIEKNAINAIVRKTKSISITKELAEFMRNYHKKVPIEVRINIKYQEPLTITLTDFRNTIKVKGNVLDKFADNPKDDIFYQTILNKFNDTPYYLDNIIVNNDKKAFVSVKEINDLRKKAVYELSNQRINNFKRHEVSFSLINNKFSKINSSIEAVVHNQMQYLACKDAGINVIYSDYKSSLNNLSRLTSKSIDNVMIHNLSQLSTNNTASPYFNVVNSRTIQVLNHLNVNKIYVSYELSIEDIAKINFDKSLNIGFPIYGRMDVMVTKHCIVSHAHNQTDKKCLKCVNNEYYLIDEYNNKFPVFTEIEDGCNNRILDYKVRNLITDIGYLKSIGVNLFLLTFTTESYDETLKIINECKKAI